VRRLAKIPTCIGIGPTKTIAKLANRLAKDDFTMQGVCDLRDDAARAAFYDELPVTMVWGIGGKTVEKLNRQGVASIADFVALKPQQVRDMLTVTGARVQAELRGLSCIPLTLAPAPRQGIAVTRTFGHLVTSWTEIREAVAAFATRAGEKLRAEGLEVRHLSVFAHTNPHNGDAWYSGQRSAQIEATSDTLALVGEAVRLLRGVWRPGFRYFKAGVMLNGPK
jgi:DNA polymerase V